MLATTLRVALKVITLCPLLGTAFFVGAAALGAGLTVACFAGVCGYLTGAGVVLLTE